MNDTVRDWAPLQATTGEAVRNRVAEAVAAWDARWFPAGRLDFSLATALAGRDAGGAPWRSFGASVATRIPRGAAARLVERALGVRLEGLVLTAADRCVVAALAQRIADDLARSIRVALGLEGDGEPAGEETANPWGPLGGATVTISDARVESLCCAIRLEALAPICKAGLGPPRRSTSRLADRRKTIGSTPVRVDATLGRANLKLAELRALAPGDIVVLDSAVDGGIELTVARSATPVARARLDEQQGRLVLTLQSHPS